MTQGFGDEAAEMANETEVESPAAGDSAEAGATSAGQETVEPGAAEETAEPVEPTAVTDPQAEQADQTGETTSQPDELAATQAALADRTSDLQRVTAEYANYRKRVERDRQLVEENATYKVLTPIIDVLDTIDRAREHGDLEPGLKAVADQLERGVEGLGLVRFGAPGEAFDPTVHEALSHMGEDPEVEVTTCKVIAKSGYRIGDRVVRAAQVLVVDPAAG